MGKIIDYRDLPGGTHNQTTRKITRFSNTGRKLFSVRKESKDVKLQKEIDYLISLPDNLKIHFPKILAYEKNIPPFFYEMEWYDQKTLRRAIFDGDINPELSFLIIQKKNTRSC